MRDRVRRLRTFALNVVAAVCLVRLEIALHELAHAVAAELLGVRVRRVVIGNGSVVRTFRVARRRVEIRERCRPGDWGGAVHYSRLSSRRSVRPIGWRQNVAIDLAGPAATVAWMLFCAVTLRYTYVFLPSLVWTVCTLHGNEGDLRSACRTVVREFAPEVIATREYLLLGVATAAWTMYADAADREEPR